MDPIIWAVLLMLLGIALLILEIFVPSGGILGFLAVASVLGAIVVAYQFHGTTTGLMFGGFAVIAVPTTIMLSLKYLPNTAIGKRLLLMEPNLDAESADDLTEQLQKLVGRVGTAESLMLPGGTVRVEETNYDAVSEAGMPIEPRQAVEVVKVRHERLVVRPTDRLPEAPPRETTAEEDLLNKPLDTLGLGDIDEPLG